MMSLNLHHVNSYITRLNKEVSISYTKSVRKGECTKPEKGQNV